MKKTTFLFTALLCAVKFCAQAPQIQWQKCLGGTGSDSAYYSAVTSDGGSVSAGESRSTDLNSIGNHGNSDILVIKLNATGDVLWSKVFGGTSDERAYKILQTSDNGYIVTGFTYSTDGDVTNNHGNMDIWVIKLDIEGNIEWQKTYGGTNQDCGYDIEQLADGQYILSGYTVSVNGDITLNHGATDALLMKLDASGTLIWQKTFGGTKFDSAVAVEVTTDGGFAFIGSTNSNNGDVSGNHGLNTLDYWVVKTTATGNLQWQKTLGGAVADEGTAIKQTLDGGFIVTGKTSSTDGQVTGLQGSKDYWTVKLTSSGDLTWQKAYGGTLEDVAFDVFQLSDGTYTVIGYTGSSNGDVDLNHANSIPTNDIWILHLNSDGSIAWQTSLGNSGYQDAHSIRPTADGGYLIAGNSGGGGAGDVSGFIGGSTDFWIVKLAPNGLGVNLYANQAEKVYPNPVTSTLYSVSGQGFFGQINVFDLSGKKIFTAQGEVASIDFSAIGAGMYILEYEDRNHLPIRTKVIKL